MRDHGSIGLFQEWCFWWDIWLWVFWPFPFLFLFSAGRKSRWCTRFWLVIKGRGPLPIVVSFLFSFGCDNSVLFKYCPVQRPFCIFLLLSSDLWSGIFLSFLLSSNLCLGIFFFCFLPIFDRELLFLLFSSDLWSGTSFSSFLCFLRGRGWTFSPWVKVYGELGFWLKACRMVGHDICQGIGLANGSGIKECPILFPWHTCNNDDLEILCKTGHACTHVDTQASCFYGHVTLGLRIHFHYLSQPSVSKTCSFINSCIHPSPFWAFGKIFTAFTLQVHTHFFSKALCSEWQVHFLSRACWLFS